MEKILDQFSTPVTDSEISALMEKSRHIIGQKKSYRAFETDVVYTNREKTIASNLALESFSELSYLPILHKDEEWWCNSLSTVRRFALSDGAFGYFKPFNENSYNERSFHDYGVTSLCASINEVNAYRLAQAMGAGFEDLVPETVMREINGEIGSLQREVKENDWMEINYLEDEQLREDYRKAAIFDFVVGNLDRHGDNFLYGYDLKEDGSYQPRIRLIDNSFTFPRANSQIGYFFNHSLFADHSNPVDSNTGRYYIATAQLGLQSGEVESLNRAKIVLNEWMEARSIGIRQAKAAINRINHLLKDKRMKTFSSYRWSYRNSN